MIKLHKIYNINATQDDCLLIDMDYTGNEGRERTIVAYRASDPYSQLTPIITQWLNDNPDQEIIPYVPPPAPTPEEIRAAMRDLTPVQFRNALIDNDIMPNEVTKKIESIPFEKEREKALNSWNYPTMFRRLDPYIDMISAMFGLTPEQVDEMWQAALLTSE